MLVARSATGFTRTSTSRTTVSGPRRSTSRSRIRSDFADLFEVREHRLVRRGRIRRVERCTSRAEACATSIATSSELFAFAWPTQMRPPTTPTGASPSRSSSPRGRPGTLAVFIRSHRGERTARAAYGCDHADGKTRSTAAAHGSTGRPSSPRPTKTSTGSTGSRSRTSARSACTIATRAGRLGPRRRGALVRGVFGRDSLVAGLQNTVVHPGFALGRAFATWPTPGDRRWTTGATPSRARSRTSCGRRAGALRAIPHTPYYGTADATPLYLIVLHEAWKWTGDRELLRELLRHRRALPRVDRPLRRPRRRRLPGVPDARAAGLREHGLEGRRRRRRLPGRQPGEAAQGALRAAGLRLRRVDAHGRDATTRSGERRAGGRAAAQGGRAATARFEERFWCEDLGTYRLRRSIPTRQPIETIASNAGHCLWSGIASPEHAAAGRRSDCCKPDMWSGWGIRTLSADNPAYNPFSYQRGSVWPHDNGIIALGFRRYGFAAEAARYSATSPRRPATS